MSDYGDNAKIRKLFFGGREGQPEANELFMETPIGYFKSTNYAFRSIDPLISMKNPLKTYHSSNLFDDYWESMGAVNGFIASSALIDQDVLDRNDRLDKSLIER